MRQNRVLRYARLQRGWSQAALANRLSTTAQQVSRWERGETHPSPYYCEQLCQIFSQNAESLGLIAPEPQMENESSTIQVQYDYLMHSTTRSSIVDPIRPRFSPNPSSLVSRESLVTQILGQLEDGCTCALSGLPGVGKTTVAQLILNHPSYATIFPDGYLWINLGVSPDILSELVRLVGLLGVSEQERAKLHSIEAGSLLLHQALVGRRILLVINDAWTIDAILPFLVGSQSVAHIITTRSPQMALAVTDDAITRVPEFSREECLKVLNALVPGLASIESDLLDEVLQLTGGLPLAVILYSKYLRVHAVGGQPRRLTAKLRCLIDCNASLQLSAPPASTFLYTSSNLLIPSLLTTAIEMSDQHLPQVAQMAWRALSVLPSKPHSFPESVALAIIEQDIEVLDILLDAGLLESVGEGWYQMHQTIADYARLHCNEQIPLYRLIHYACQTCSSPSFARSQDFDSMLPTILAAIESARILQQDHDLIQIVLALEPFWYTHCSPKQVDTLVAMALNAASRINDQQTSSFLKVQQDKLTRHRDSWMRISPLERSRVDAL